MSKPMNQLQWIAIAVSVALHLAVLVFVLFGHVVEPPQEPAVNSVKVRMVMLPAPVPPKLVEQPKPKPKPPVKKVKLKKKAKPVIKEAKFAQKRVEEKPKHKPEPEMEPLPEIAAVEETIELKPLPEVSDPEPVAAQADVPVEDEVVKVEVSENATPSVAEKPFNVDQYQPVLKKAPPYPRRAVDKHIEGYCTVQYTVNEQGHTESLKALDDCHPYFINASLKAAKSFKYQPRLINGKPVKVLGVKNRFEFHF